MKLKIILTSLMFLILLIKNTNALESNDEWGFNEDIPYLAENEQSIVDKTVYQLAWDIYNKFKEKSIIVGNLLFEWINLNRDNSLAYAALCTQFDDETFIFINNNYIKKIVNNKNLSSDQQYLIFTGFTKIIFEQIKKEKNSKQ